MGISLEQEITITTGRNSRMVWIGLVITADKYKLLSILKKESGNPGILVYEIWDEPAPSSINYSHMFELALFPYV
jgi:hypothetical protein